MSHPRLSLPHVIAYLGSVFFIAAMATASAQIPANGIAAGGIVCLTAGLVMLGVGRARGKRVKLAGRMRAWSTLWALEAGHGITFFAALQLAPTAPVVALHLASPIFILLFCLRGLPSARQWMVLALMAASVAVAASGPAEGAYPAPLLGLILSLASAACVAGLILTVSNMTHDTDPAMGAGCQLTGAGLLLAPLTIMLMPPLGQVLLLCAIGALLMAPAFLLFWVAGRRLDPVMIGTLSLGEPVVAALLGLAVFGTQLRLVHALAAVMCAAAVLIQVRTPRPAEPAAEAEADSPAALAPVAAPVAA